MTYRPGPRPAGWQVSDTYQLGRRELTREPATYVKIRGERGVFRFMEHVSAPPAPRHRTRREWVYVVGGTAGVKMNRYFRPERIARAVKGK